MLCLNMLIVQSKTGLTRSKTKEKRCHILYMYDMNDMIMYVLDMLKMLTGLEKYSNMLYKKMACFMT